MNVNTSVNVQNRLFKPSNIQFSKRTFDDDNQNSTNTNTFLLPTWCRVYSNVSETRGSGYHSENVNMAAWRALTITRFIVFFLPIFFVLPMKANVDGASHICVSGSQVLHVNFADGPIQQCGVMNTTPASNKAKPSCAAAKAKEQAKSSQGLCVSERENV